MRLSNFKDERKACGLISARDLRWNKRYGLDIKRSSGPKARLLMFFAKNWDDAYSIFIEHQCIGDIDGDFDCEEDEDLTRIQHDEAKLHFEDHGYVECSMHNSISSVVVYWVK